MTGQRGALAAPDRAPAAYQVTWIDHGHAAPGMPSPANGLDAERRRWLAAISPAPAPARVNPVSSRTRIDGAWRIAERRLDEHLFYAIAHGGCAGMIAGAAVQLAAGDLLWIQPGVSHAFHPIPGPRMTVWHLRVGPHLPACGTPWLRVRQAWPAHALVADLVAEPALAQPADLAAAKLGAGLASLALTCWRLAGADTAAVGRLSPERLAALTRFVRSAHRTRRTPRACAAFLGLSPVHFARLLRATVGRAPRTWLMEERLRAAAQRIEESRLTIAAIAAEFGYGDAHLFSRQFRQVHGVPPRARR
jgi:AraC-like DNA-binding protein